MKETTVTRRSVLGGAAAAAAGGALLATPAGAFAQSQGGCVVPTPEQLGRDYTKFIVYLREGVTQSSTDPEVFIEARRKIYGQSRSDLEAFAEHGKQFILDRFGLDFFGVDGPTIVGPWEIDGAVLGTSTLLSSTYRAHIASEDWVPPEGWEVRDSFLRASLTQDMVLHGTWGGAAGRGPVPANASMLFGDYNIKVERAGRSARGEEILIHFESGSPNVRDSDGNLHFLCDLTHEEWGPGCACGVVRGLSIRNVLTFPASLP